MFLNFAISSEYPLWLSILCLGFGLLLSWWLYLRNASLNEAPKKVKYLLFALRTAYLSTISFLLISPFVLSLDPVVEKPILIFGQDNSQSVAQLNDSSKLKEYLGLRDNFIEACRDDFEIHFFHFGEEVEEAGEKDDFSDRLTDISSFIKEIQDRFENRNVALMMLGSDGLYNRGENPLYLPAYNPFPIYTLALGDTAQQKDAWLDKVNHNTMAFLGNTFDVQVNVGASLLQGKNSALTIRRGSKIYDRKVFSITDGDYMQSIEFSVPADEIGLLRFEAVIDEIDGEISTSNNHFFFYVDVIEGQRKVLILSQSPHPDVSALMAAINSSKHFKASSVLLKDFTGDLGEVDLLILNQLPSSKKGGRPLRIDNNDIPRLYILGKNTSISDFNNLQTGLKLNRFKGQFNEVTALVNNDFQYFALDKEVSLFEEFPPLTSPFAQYESNAKGISMIRQRIGKVATDFPLFVFYESEGAKTGVITGEGIWRWRLFNYRLKGNSNPFDETIQKIVQYLSLKEDRSRFKVDVEPSYFENNNILIKAEFYDKAYELNNEHEAKLTLKNEAGEIFDYIFLKSQRTYSLDMGKLNGGEYSWKASVNDGLNVFEKSGSFSIKALQLEWNKLQADHTMLYNLSAKNGGEMLYPNELPSFADEILNENKYRPILHYNERMKELISLKWLFVVLLLFFSTEWFIRKWMGLN